MGDTLAAMRNQLLALMLALAPAPRAFMLPLKAQTSSPAANTAPHKLTKDARVFVEPMNGFEIYMSAAILKKKVPLTIVDSKEKADFIIQGTSELDKAGWAKTIFISGANSARASINVKNSYGETVYAYAVDKLNSNRGNQSTAEACAKHLKEAIEKANK